MPDAVIARYLRQVGVEATPRVLDYFHQPEAVAYQFIVSVSLPGQKQNGADDEPPTNKSSGGDSDTDFKVLPARAHALKPMAASWQTWRHVFSNLQEKEYIIRGLEVNMDNCRDELKRMHADLQMKNEELERVYATRSWRLLRRVANLWRGIGVQGRLTPG